MPYQGPSVNFIRTYINSEQFAGLTIDQIMQQINILWDQKQARKGVERSRCNQLYQDQQSCVQDPSCLWAKKSPKKGYCKNSLDNDIIEILLQQKKITPQSSRKEVKMAIYLYKNGLSF